METTPDSRRSRLRQALAASGLAAVLAAASLIPASPASAAVSLPEVIPSIDGWVAADGSFTADTDPGVFTDGTNERVDAIAGIFRDELAASRPGATDGTGDAASGDIELQLDESRTDLGPEGYELVVGDEITITAAEPTGVLYGTRTVLQMLGQQDVLPAGSIVDVPEYEERGVTLCACVINISPEFIDRLIEEMSYLKLNTLLLELKVKVDGYPETNTWSYYTKDDIRTLVEKASAYGIEVIPEINSPGHMEIWLENLPELQLTNEATGEKDEVRMDITKDASFEFYTDLIDEYSEVFTADSWHMGADEYMLGSGYANYPQIKRFAEERFGPGATENDVVAWYINRINDYVKSTGKELRIWNDGVMTTNRFEQIDTDIVVEHWNQAGSSIRPQQFLDWGHELVNNSNSLYMVRGGYGVNSRGLYDSGWTPEVFYGQTVTTGTEQIRGARLSAWPDGGTPAEAENTTEQRMFEPLRFVAQSTWAGTRPWASFDAFTAAMETIGHTPLWENAERQPLPDGAFAITGANDEGTLAPADGGALALGDSGEPFTFTRTNDGYYTITAPDGRCLDLSRDGTMRLGVPLEIGADAQLSACATTTLQKWQLRRVDGGYTIANAASQQFLSVSAGLVDVPVSGEATKTVPDGLVVQTPADWGKTVWKITGDVALNATPAAITAAPGDEVAVTVTATNTSDTDVTGATVRVAATPAGWSARPGSVEVGDLAQGAEAEAAFTLNNVSAATGSGEFVFELVDGAGAVVAQATATTNAICTTEQLTPSAIAAVSSQQTSGEPAPNGPAAAAIDGNPATYWHSQWSPTTAQYPHSIVVDLGAEESVCGLWYTGRSSSGSGGANGRIANYDVYTSTTVATVDGAWGEPVASGTFVNSADAQLAPFAPKTARYVKLVAKSEVNGNPWATIGELAVAGPAVTVPEVQIDVVAQTRCLGSKAYVTVKATNREDEPVSLVMTTAYGEKSFASVAAGKNAVHSFTTRLASVPAGTVTVEASATLNGAAVTSTLTADYDARSCG
ncbi:family 20 glycosylhydrolase [Agromyces sp. NPDC058484]|uniref:family 20 glycosylhydrolase n=1 Tax=Agromyces sp. NPDC058484 TaxID=3346524 RepID=UPI00366012B7